jgi:glycosyltransferase involved in cell wall biosynthesis
LKKKIIYDASVLVSGSVTGNIYKTGLYRVSYELLKEFIKSNDFDLFLYDIFDRERELVKYVQKEFPQCDRIKVHSLWYRLLIFPLGNTADFLRNIQQSNRSRLLSVIAGLLKICFLFIERVAKKTETVFFIKNNFKNSIKGCDVYYSTYFPIPLEIRTNTNIKKVYTVHDMIPIIHPEYFSSPYNQKLVKEVIDNIGLNDFTIAVSESTKRDILKYRQGFFSEHIVVAPLAASSIFYEETNHDKILQIKNKYHISSSDYILSVCTLEPRKNLVLLIKAFKKLIKQDSNFDLKLVLIGSNGWNSSLLIEEIKEINCISNNQIILTGFVPDEDLSGLYSGAHIFVYPSLYEGFGLPVLEAMKCGVPVICSNNSSLPEVVGNSGILVNPESSDELANAILLLNNNLILRQLLKQRSIERASLFSWNKMADTVRNVFNSVLVKDV